MHRLPSTHWQSNSLTHSHLLIRLGQLLLTTVDHEAQGGRPVSCSEQGGSGVAMEAEMGGGVPLEIMEDSTIWIIEWPSSSLALRPQFGKQNVLPVNTTSGMFCSMRVRMPWLSEQAPFVYWMSFKTRIPDLQSTEQTCSKKQKKKKQAGEGAASWPWENVTCRKVQAETLDLKYFGQKLAH